MFKKFTNGCVRVVNRWLPDAFLFAIILTIVVFIAAMIGTQQGPLELVWSWGGQGEVKDGFWSLLSFAMQMALVLVLGSAMASAKACKKALAAIATLAHDKKSAILVTTFVSTICCWLNWGFGLVAGALLALAAWMAFIRVFVVRAKRFGIDSASRILFVVGYFVHLLLYLKFAYDYPQECSMHFRYMEIELLFPAIALAFIWQEGTKDQLEMRRREGGATGHPAVKRAISQVLFVLLLAFCMLSTAMTAVWCLL